MIKRKSEAKKSWEAVVSNVSMDIAPCTYDPHLATKACWLCGKRTLVIEECRWKSLSRAWAVEYLKKRENYRG